MNTNRNQPLWTCPKCGAKFVTKNLWHSCGKATLFEASQEDDTTWYPPGRTHRECGLHCRHAHACSDNQSRRSGACYARFGITAHLDKNSFVRNGPDLSQYVEQHRPFCSPSSEKNNCFCPELTAEYSSLYRESCQADHIDTYGQLV